MSRRFGLFGVCVISSVCVLLLLASHQLSGYGQRQAIFTSGVASRNIQQYYIDQAPHEPLQNNDSTPSIKEIIAQQRAALSQEFNGLELPGGGVLQEYQKQPLRNVIITTWRSGSTFLGELINTVPGNFYHYEPLLDYEIMQIRGPPQAAGALKNLRHLLRCEYEHMQHYLQYGKTHVYLFTHNTRLWEQCQLYPQYCWNATFLTEMCQLFPFQSMKIVRLRLRLVEELLQDEGLNVRVLLLVRDPRGTLQSRKHRDWCPGQPDCDHASLLCSDMLDDYMAAVKLSNLYPDRFRAIRYEDFSLDPYRGVMELFEFFHLPLHPSVTEFLDSHTRANVGGVSSTFRNSRSAPFHWRYELTLSEVLNIEEQCEPAMHSWGYVSAQNSSVSLRDLNPLMEYTLTAR